MRIKLVNCPTFFLVLFSSLFVVADYAFAQCSVSESEPNDDFYSADLGAPVGCFNSTGSSVTLSGQTLTSGDPDLFAIPRSFATGQSVSGQLALGIVGTYVSVLFNENNELLSRSYIRPFGGANFNFHAPSTQIFLGLMAPAGTGGGGSYSNIITRRTNSVSVEPVSQKVLLDFDGGTNISIHSDPPINFPAFDASSVSSRYAGQTDRVVNVIVQRMRDTFSGYNVEFYITGVDDLPTLPFSTVYFGGYNSALLGLADSVNEYNTVRNDNAIVYTGSFSAYDSMRLSAEQMGQMIGNVAAHELGHLLGLYHTADPVDTMDTTGSAWDLMSDTMSFTNTDLERSVFATGRENSPALLSLIVGGEANVPPDDPPPSAASWNWSVLY